MPSLSFEELRVDYELKFEACQITDVKAVSKVVAKIITNGPFYEEAELQTNVPWYLIGAIHSKEASCNMSKQIFNGEPWSKRTTLVPKGLGPWKSWLDSTMMSLNQYKNQNWTLAKCLYFSEKWNGMGYRIKHPEVNSPYLWASTNLYSKGGYPSDGKFDENYVAKNPGVGAIIKYISENGITINKE